MLKYSDPFCILFSFRSVPQITNIHTGIGILRNGTEPKLIIVREVFFRLSCMNIYHFRTGIICLTNAAFNSYSVSIQD